MLMGSAHSKEVSVNGALDANCRVSLVGNHLIDAKRTAGQEGQWAVKLQARLDSESIIEENEQE